MLLKPFYQCVAPTEGPRLSICHWVMLRLKGKCQRYGVPFLLGQPAGLGDHIAKEDMQLIRVRSVNYAASSTIRFPSKYMMTTSSKSILQKCLAGCQGTAGEESELFLYISIRDSSPLWAPGLWYLPGSPQCPTTPRTCPGGAHISTSVHVSTHTDVQALFLQVVQTPEFCNPQIRKILVTNPPPVLSCKM